MLRFRLACLLSFCLACGSADGVTPREDDEASDELDDEANDDSSSPSRDASTGSGPSDAAARRDASGARDGASGRDAAPLDGQAPRAPRDDGAARDAGGPTSGDDALDEAASAAALEALERYLAGAAPRAPIDRQAFAAVPLTRADAERARELLWDDLAQTIRMTRASEVGASESTVRTIPGEAGLSLRYYLTKLGDAPAQGRSLFISMHGGGKAASATNDSQWKNQLALAEGYAPKDAIWIAPRAPIDDWNMWFVEGIDALLERLITNMIVFEGIDPNRVYLTGYSAGGDGVYQLGPRMAERWAGAGMSAGHPNTASPLNLRNVAFAIHVGGNDTAFERNAKGEEWGKQLEALAKADPGGYPVQWKVHPGLPHWMNMADAVSVPFLQSHTRDPYPSKVVWRQAEVTRPHFYWLAVDRDNQKFESEVRASYAMQEVTLSGVEGLSRLTVRFADEMLDLDLPIRITRDGRTLYEGKVARTIDVLARTLGERNDPAMVFSAEVAVALQ